MSPAPDRPKPPPAKEALPAGWAASQARLQVLSRRGQGVRGHFVWLAQDDARSAARRQIAPADTHTPAGTNPAGDLPARSVRLRPGAFVVDAALDEMPEESDLAAVAQLQLDWQGPGGASLAARGQAWLSHQITERACAVNEAPLLAGRALRVRSGDVVELGLLRMVLELAPDSAVAAERASTAEPAGPRGLIEDFELADLARPADSSAAWVMDGRPQVADVIALELAPAAASAGPAGGAPPASPGDGPVDSGDAALDGLHARYLQMLRDPASLAQGWGQSGTATGYRSQADTADPLAELQVHAQVFESLHDMVAARPSVASLLHEADGLSEVQLLAPPPAQSVLHLFAPQDRRAAGSHELSRLASLTRREHHLPAADSALPRQTQPLVPPVKPSPP